MSDCFYERSSCVSNCSCEVSVSAARKICRTKGYGPFLRFSCCVHTGVVPAFLHASFSPASFRQYYSRFLITPSICLHITLASLYLSTWRSPISATFSCLSCTFYDLLRRFLDFLEILDFLPFLDFLIHPPCLLTKSSVELLASMATNSTFWKWQMKSLLQYKKIHTIVNGTETLEDAEDKEEWQAREYSTFTLLCNSVERRVLTPLLQCTTSHEIWTTLLSIYEHKSSADIHELQRRFFNAKIQPEQSLSDYIGDLQLILSELTDIGDETFTEDSLISKLTSTLPEGYDAFLTAWDSTPADDPTFYNLQLRLYKEEARLKRRINAEVTSDTTAFYSHRSSSGIHNTHPNPPHMRPPSSGSSSQYGNSRNAGRGYQPTGSQYKSRFSHSAGRTSYGRTSYGSLTSCSKNLLEGALLQTDLSEEISTLVSFFSKRDTVKSLDKDLDDRLQHNIIELRKKLEAKTKASKGQEGDLAANLGHV